MHEELSRQIKKGNTKSLARAISFIENEQQGYEDLLRSLKTNSSTNIIGITGPPGAGKSTLTDAMIGELIKQAAKVAVLCVDPSSPFNLGAVLGDRIRMSEWYTHPNVFIRSLATRGSMGGLSPKIIEITDLIKTASFDHIIVETVGVGQSEIEIAGLADTTLVVIVPESGDEVQTMKAGLMEIANVFVINKSDRPDADLFERNLRSMLAPAFHKRAREIPVIKTVATEKKGIVELMTAIKNNLSAEKNEDRHLSLLTDKAWQLLIRKKMNDINKSHLQKLIQSEYKKPEFNLYSFVDKL
ncbi:MAG: methylmalonyl Co-A mutase-associated GTPase MeaB [Chitinophagales bacterium]